MAPKLAQVAQDVAYLHQPLRIVLCNFTSLLPIFSALETQRQPGQSVKQAIPEILSVCRGVCGDSFAAPRLTESARAYVSDFERQLNILPGDGLSGIAQFLLGTPSIAALLEEYFNAGGSDRIFQATEWPHFNLHLWNGLPALQLSYVLTN